MNRGGAEGVVTSGYGCFKEARDERVRSDWGEFGLKRSQLETFVRE